MRSLKLCIISFICSVVVSCTEQSSKKREEPVNVLESVPVKTDSVLSDRPVKSSIIEPAFSTDKLFGLWVIDSSGPHADFKFDENSFHIVEFDGEDGRMPYILKKNEITVFYPDFKMTGLIQKAENDSLVIYWASGETDIYVKWKN
jgi:hypothetical protein